MVKQIFYGMPLFEICSTFYLSILDIYYSDSEEEEKEEEEEAKEKEEEKEENSF
jgi:hypothetical protein